jgi:hypothetical protein
MNRSASAVLTVLRIVTPTLSQHHCPANMGGCAVQIEAGHESVHDLHN